MNSNPAITHILYASVGMTDFYDKHVQVQIMFIYT